MLAASEQVHSNKNNPIFRPLSQIASFASAALHSKDSHIEIPEGYVDKLREALKKRNFNRENALRYLHMNPGALKSMFKTGQRVSAKVTALSTSIRDLKKKLSKYARFNRIFQGTLKRIYEETKNSDKGLKRYFLGPWGPGFMAHARYIEDNIMNPQKLYQYRKELSVHRNTFLINEITNIFSAYELAEKFDNPKLQGEIVPGIKKLVNLVFLNHLRDPDLNTEYKRPTMTYAAYLDEITEKLKDEQLWIYNPKLKKKVLGNAYNLISRIIHKALRSTARPFGCNEYETMELLEHMARFLDEQELLKSRKEEGERWSYNKAKRNRAIDYDLKHFLEVLETQGWDAAMNRTKPRKVPDDYRLDYFTEEQRTTFLNETRSPNQDRARSKSSQSKNPHRKSTRRY